ncbi:MAG TPA: hypothetical protein VGQ59_07810 [Cyclobacteriaceae bacterium]|jgi:hypothetical protein|nr:hypothetical protein [Cyclobacteriaceae bacterium]
MNEEAEFIWTHGKYLISIEYYAFKINLYSVKKNFYEIFYHPNTNEITKINRASFIDLEKYLNRIELEKLQ